MTLNGNMNTNIQIRTFNYMNNNKLIEFATANGYSTIL